METVDPKGVREADAIIVKGSYSLLGAVVGRVKVVTDFEKLVSGEVSIDADDILVTIKVQAAYSLHSLHSLTRSLHCTALSCTALYCTQTSNYWNQYLTSLKAIVTMDGSPTAHPMLIGRERHLPVICGVRELIRRLLP